MQTSPGSDTSSPLDDDDVSGDELHPNVLLWSLVAAVLGVLAMAVTVLYNVLD